MNAMTAEVAQRANHSLAQRLAREESRARGFQQENAGLLRKRELMKQEIEQLRGRLNAPHPDTLKVQRLRTLANQARIEAEVLGGPGAIPTIPVSEFAEILLGDER